MRDPGTLHPTDPLDTGAWIDFALRLWPGSPFGRRVQLAATKEFVRETRAAGVAEQQKVARLARTEIVKPRGGRPIWV